jgi:hypothetical protein
LSRTVEAGVGHAVHAGSGLLKGQYGGLVGPVYIEPKMLAVLCYRRDPMNSVPRAAWLRRTRRVAAYLAIAYAIFLSAMFVLMSQPPERFGHIMAKVPMPTLMLVPFETMWNVARGGALHVGDAAPDFTLPRVDHSGSVRLSSFRGRRPVVLVFGSYT